VRQPDPSEGNKIMKWILIAATLAVASPAYSMTCADAVQTNDWATTQLGSVIEQYNRTPERALLKQAIDWATIVSSSMQVGLAHRCPGFDASALAEINASIRRLSSSLN
jgi:hypothetical protein